MHRLARTALLLLPLLPGLAPPHAHAQSPAFRLPAECRQLIVGIADDWSSTHVTLRLWRRDDSGRWVPDSTPWPGRLGKDGLGWGAGLHPRGLDGPAKTEKDARAPCGVFLLGDAYGYAPSEPTHPGLPYHQVGPRDMWVEDASSKYYNQHLRMNHPAPRNDWERKQQMRLNDPAHALKLFIRHNAPPNATPGLGSAIFFHIWREDGKRATAGCTTMTEQKLRALLLRTDPARRPLFVLLPRPAYDRFRQPWGLP